MPRNASQSMGASQSIEGTVVKQRDASRDNALVLRSTATGTAASRTHAFLAHCVQVQVSDITERDIVSYMSTRALFEGGFDLHLNSQCVGDPVPRGVLAKPFQLPKQSYRQKTYFASKPQWQAANATVQRLAEEVVSKVELHALRQSLHPVVRSLKPGWGPYQAASLRAVILRDAAARMGLAQVPVVSLMDLQRHAYFADRGLFEDAEEGDDEDDESDGKPDPPLARINSASGSQSSRGRSIPGVESKPSFDAMRASFATQDAASSRTMSPGALASLHQAKAKQKTSSHSLHLIRRRADRERRLAGADLLRSDPGADISGAAVFEWTRAVHRNTAAAAGAAGGVVTSVASVPQHATEEFWLCVKGIVLLADLSRVNDPGRRLYYSMVLIPMFSGKEISADLAEMIKPDLASELDDFVDSAGLSGAVAEDTDGWAAWDTDDADDFEGPWAEVFRAESDAGVCDTAGSLCELRRRNPERYRARALMSKAQRQHVDRVLEILLQDFLVIGVLDDLARELWL